MDYFKFVSGNIEISKSSRDGVVIDIFLIDKKNDQHLLAEFKRDGEGFLFKNYFEDLDSKVSKLLDIDHFSDIFHLMCYVVNHFVLPAGEELAFPDEIQGMSLDDNENEEDESEKESFLDEISNIDFDDIKKNLNDD